MGTGLGQRWGGYLKFGIFYDGGILVIFTLLSNFGEFLQFYNFNFSTPISFSW